MKKNLKWLFFLLPLLFFIGSCNSDAPSDTPTYGNLKISVDETFQPLIESELDTFSKIYQYAFIKSEYKSEQAAFDDLMTDSVRLIVAPRKLNADELKEFERWEIVPRQTKVAYDAVALIGSMDLKDSTLTLAEINSLLSGKALSTFKNVRVVFDNNNSSTINFLKERTGVQQLSPQCYALNSSKAVLDYIGKTKNSIGVIGVNWISDLEDSTNLSFHKGVKVLEVANTDTSEYYKPYQAYIAQRNYPLWREVYIISREAYTGLGTGFTAFVASERGQRIVLKFGLVPATMPVRLVELINEDL